MDRVHHAQQRPFSQIRGAGIAIREVDPQQRHTGILYCDSGSSEVFLLHLAWHFDLRHETPRDNYLWVDPAITARRLVQVAAICRLVWRANGKKTIPFGFGSPSDCLDAATCIYLFGPTRVGLTCATFVLAVFHRAGLALVEYAAWPVGRAGDPEWQRLIVDKLRETPTATPEHIQAVESDIGTTVRYRPEEVAGAATVSPYPAQFAMAEVRGQQILIRLRNPQGFQSPLEIPQFLHQAFRIAWNWIREKILGK